MSTEKEVLVRLSQCEHLMRTNLEIESYNLGNENENDDLENPGFLKGWHFYLDIISNSVIAFPKQETLDKGEQFALEVRIGDDIVAKFKDPELIEEFLLKCEKKSHYFSNVASLVPDTKISKKLGLK